MEFYESTSFGLRVVTAEYLCSTSMKLRIQLFPMFHIGSKEYYENVSILLKNCDLILYEAIKFNMGRLKINNMDITAKKLGLVSQKELDINRFSNKLIHADLDKKTGIKAWRTLSILDKLKYKNFFPVYIYFQDRNLTRKKLVKYFMKSNTDLDKIYGPLFDRKESIKKFIHNERNNVVFQKIEEIHDEFGLKNMRIGIVYGAAHMKPIANCIEQKLNYKLVKADYLEVFKV